MLTTSKFRTTIFIVSIILVSFTIHQSHQYRFNSVDIVGIGEEIAYFEGPDLIHNELVQLKNNSTEISLFFEKPINHYNFFLLDENMKIISKNKYQTWFEVDRSRVTIKSFEPLEKINAEYIIMWDDINNSAIAKFIIIE
jgi:hypothetical protein